MSRRIGLLLALAMLVAASSVNAVPDSAVAGPYKVSFDLGLTRNDYSITIPVPKTTEALDGTEGTDYEILINSTNWARLTEWGINQTVISRAVPPDQADASSDSAHLAEIHIIESKRAQTVLPDDELVKALKKQDEKDRRVSAIKVSTRMIDNASGAIASMKWASDPDLYKPVELYDCIYFPSFDPSHVMVEIVSFYPWDNGTLQLLKTIHVERIK